MTSRLRLGEHAKRAAATYGAAADHSTAPAVGFWDRLGNETVRFCRSLGAALPPKVIVPRSTPTPPLAGRCSDVGG